MWKGMVFNCVNTNNEIFLLQTQVLTLLSGINGTCNDGAMVGESFSTSVKDNVQLHFMVNVAVNSSMIRL